MAQLTIDNLRQVFKAVAGADETVNLDGDIIHAEFAEIGYDSIAVLEAAGQIQRDYGIVLDEDALGEARTFHDLLELVNAYE
jgi:acyl carrier protein